MAHREQTAARPALMHHLVFLSKSILFNSLVSRHICNGNKFCALRFLCSLSMKSLCPAIVVPLYQVNIASTKLIMCKTSVAWPVGLQTTDRNTRITPRRIQNRFKVHNTFQIKSIHISAKRNHGATCSAWTPQLFALI